MFSDDDLEKPVKNDMYLFKLLKAEYPILGDSESSIFQQIKYHYLLIGKLVANNESIYISTLILNGAIVRSLNSYKGALWALGNGNPHVFYDCLRSQCETLSLLHYCTLNPDYIKAATMGARNHSQEDLRIINILTMVKKLDKLHKGILKDYDALCNLVHPNPASLYASIQPLDEQERVVIIGSRLPNLKDEQVKLYMKLLMIWTRWILEKIIELAQIFSSPLDKSTN